MFHVSWVQFRKTYWAGFFFDMGITWLCVAMQGGWAHDGRMLDVDAHFGMLSFLKRSEGLVYSRWVRIGLQACIVMGRFGGGGLRGCEISIIESMSFFVQWGERQCRCK